MSKFSRRDFIGSAVTTAIVARGFPRVLATRDSSPVPQPSQSPARRLRVQFTPGGHTAPLQIYAMFETPLFQDLDSVVLPHPDAFAGINGTAAPDVIVTYDWITGAWAQKEQEDIRKHLQAGRGVVVLHHAVGTNNNEWQWWSEEVIGCYLYNPGVPGMKTQARLKQFPIQTITPVGSHPIVKGIEPFQLPWDETFPNMWISPKATVLFKSDDPSFNNPALGWVGPPLSKGRAVCFQPGHTRFACQDPNYRNVVHNMILWAGGRLS
jgi:type 1 glutamine amidotransferase